MTSSAFHKLWILVKCDQEEIMEPMNVTQIQLEMTTPFVPYKRSILEEVPVLVVEDEPITQIVQGIIEPPQDEVQDNNAIEETIILSNANDD